MELKDYRRLVRREWKVMFAALVVAGAVAVALVMYLPKQYVSTTELLAGNPQSAQTATGGPATTYAGLIASNIVIRQVIDDLKLDVTPAEFRQNLNISQVTDASLIRVTIRATSADSARLIAQKFGSVAATFVRAVVESESVGPVDLSEPDPQTGQEPPVRVVQQADDPEGAVSPNPVVVVLVCVLGGLLLGGVLALVRHVRRLTIEDLDDLAEVAPEGVSALGVVVDPDTSSDRLMVANSFRGIATAFNRLVADGGIAVVTSVEPARTEGVALHLARTVARAGRSVAIVDADARRGVLTTNVGAHGKVGLIDVIDGEASLDNALVTVDRSLVVLPSGSAGSDPGESLASLEMNGVVARLRADHDIVLIVAAPAQQHSDAAVLSALADHLLVVVQLGGTKPGQLRAQLGSLQSVGAPGITVVAVEAAGHSVDPESMPSKSAVRRSEDDGIVQNGAAQLHASSDGQSKDYSDQSSNASSVDTTSRPTRRRRGSRSRKSN